MKKQYKSIVLGLFALSFTVPQKSSAQCRMLDLQAEGWRLAFEDDFKGSSLDVTKWKTDPGGLPANRAANGAYAGWGSEYFPQPKNPDGTPNPEYDSRLVVMKPGLDSHDPTVDGVLSLTAIPLANAINTGVPYKDTNTPRIVRYKSGIILSKTDIQPYGAYVMRAKMPINFDYKAWATFWLWSCTTEIDILDGIAPVDIKDRYQNIVRQDQVYLTNVIDNISITTNNDLGTNECLNPPFRYTSYDSQPGTRQKCAHNGAIWRESNTPIAQQSRFDDSYNTYGMIWTPEQVTFLFNGRAFAVVPRSVVRTLPKWATLIASMQTFEEANSNNPTNTEYTMDIDYIKVYDRPDVNGFPDYPVSSYLSQNEFINYSIDTLNAKNPASYVPLVSVHSDAGSIAVNSAANEVYYRGIDQRMYVASYNVNAQTWPTSKLSISSPEDYVTGSVVYDAEHNRIYYRGANGQLQFYVKTSNGWAHDEVANNTPVKISSTPRSIVIGNGGIYWVGTNRKIQYVSPYVSWGTYQYSLESNDNQSLVSGDVCVADGKVFYKGEDMTIQYYWSPDGWGTRVHSWANTSGGGVDYTAWPASATPGSLTGGIGGVYYIGNDQKIHSFIWAGPSLGFQHHELNPNGIDAQKARGDLQFWPSGQNGRLTYLGYDGRIQGFYNVATMAQHDWIDNYFNTGEYLSFDNSGNNMNKFSSVISDGSYSRLFYCDNNQKLRFFVWEPCAPSIPTECGKILPLLRNVLSANEKESQEVNTLAVHPNPGTGSFAATLPVAFAGAKVHYTVYSNTGVVVKQGYSLADQVRVDLTTKPAGMYLLLAEANGKILRAKIVKE